MRDNELYRRLASLQFRDEAADTDNGRFVC
jgi:ATP-binding cassette, subfamily B, bacterial